MKRLYTATDIDELAATGQRVLFLAQDAILTPLARDRARERGLQVQVGSSSSPDHPASPAASPSATPSPAAASFSGLAADARQAFISLLQQARAQTADIAHLAQCFDDLLRATEQGAPLHLPAHPQPVHLSTERQQALATTVQQLLALGRYLFGPDAALRRFDILWALTTLEALLAA